MRIGLNTDVAATEQKILALRIIESQLEVKFHHKNDANLHNLNSPMLRDIVLKFVLSTFQNSLNVAVCPELQENLERTESKIG